MNYLITDDEDNGQGQDSGQGTTTEAPPAPAAPNPTPPAPPAASEPAEDPFLSSWDDDDDDLLAGGTTAEADPFASSTAQAAPAPAPAQDTPPRPIPPANPPMAPGGQVDLSVQAPQLEQMAPGVQVIGQVPENLSSLVLDVDVPVEVAFGNASLTVEEFLELGAGSVVELDRPVEAPVELKVRGRTIAMGQLVTVGGRYGLRITEMVREA